MVQCECSGWDTLRPGSVPLRCHVEHKVERGGVKSRRQKQIEGGCVGFVFSNMLGPQEQKPHVINKWNVIFRTCLIGTWFFSWRVSLKALRLVLGGCICSVPLDNNGISSIFDMSFKGLLHGFLRSIVNQ